jgi:hypothetical protein
MLQLTIGWKGMRHYFMSELPPEISKRKAKRLLKKARKATGDVVLELRTPYKAPRVAVREGSCLPGIHGPGREPLVMTAQISGK